MNFDLRDVVLIAISVFVSLVFLVGNNWLLSINQPRYAVVDILDVYGQKQKDFVDVILKKEITDKDRAELVESAQHFGRDIDSTLKAVAKECNCILLNKSAVVNPEMLKDYTQEVKVRLGQKR